MIDTSSLFLHVLGAVGILGGGIAQVLAGVRLRAASAASEIASWAAHARTAGHLILVSAVVSLLTGGHLAGAVWTTEARSGFSHPFITLGMLGLLLLAPVGPMLGGARLRRLVAAAEAGADAEGLIEDTRSATLWGAVHSLVGVGVGLIALMVYKPGWVAGVLLLVATFAAGWAAGAVLASRRPATSR